MSYQKGNPVLCPHTQDAFDIGRIHFDFGCHLLEEFGGIPLCDNRQKMSVAERRVAVRNTSRNVCDAARLKTDTPCLRSSGASRSTLRTVRASRKSRKPSEMPEIGNAHFEPFHLLRQVRIEPRKAPQSRGENTHGHGQAFPGDLIV